MPATLLKKRIWHKYFSANFSEFLRAYFLIGHLWWVFLLPSYQSCNVKRENKIFIIISSGNLFKVNFFDNIETSLLICSADQLTSFK